jgi:hypothetical protein
MEVSESGPILSFRWAVYDGVNKIIELPKGASR